MSGEPVAWRFFVEDDPNMKPFWTVWTANKADADFAMRHFPERKYECAYPATNSDAKRDILLDAVNSWLDNLGQENCGNTMLFRDIRTYLEGKQ